MDRFKDIFNNPKSYNIIPFDNVYNDSKIIGHFKPFYLNINKNKIMTLFDVVENEGFGVMENPIIEINRKTFHSLDEAIVYLDNTRKDKNLSWASWETPYTYEIQSHSNGKFLHRYNREEIKEFTKNIIKDNND